MSHLDGRRLFTDSTRLPVEPPACWSRADTAPLGHWSLEKNRVTSAHPSENQTEVLSGSKVRF